LGIRHVTREPDEARKDELSLDDAATIKLKGLAVGITRYNRWLAHYDSRLNYEKAMLGAQGARNLLQPKARPAQLPLLNYRAPEGIKAENQWNRKEIINYSQVEMTKAEYAKIGNDYKSTRNV